MHSYHYPRCRQRSTSHETPGHFTLLAIQMCCVYRKTAASLSSLATSMTLSAVPENTTPMSWAYFLARTLGVFPMDGRAKSIPVTIRLYPDSRFNVRVYNQRCQECGKLSRPRLDGSYAERVVHWLQKWSRIDVEAPFFSGERNGPHLTAFCEGCRNGRCKSQTTSMS